MTLRLPQPQEGVGWEMVCLLVLEGHCQLTLDSSKAAVVEGEQSTDLVLVGYQMV
jgi:hypothetical protein